MTFFPASFAISAIGKATPAPVVSTTSGLSFMKTPMLWKKFTRNLMGFLEGSTTKYVRSFLERPIEFGLLNVRKKCSLPLYDSSSRISSLRCPPPEHARQIFILPYPTRLKSLNQNSPITNAQIGRAHV